MKQDLPLGATLAGDTDGHPSGKHDEPFNCPLPSGDWTACTNGPPQDWSPQLKAYTTTIAAFPYPAAIWWGDELVLLYNRAWLDAGGTDEQGCKQRGRLTADTWQAIRASRDGGVPTRVNSSNLLRRDEDAKYTVLLSPLFTDGLQNSNGVLAQLFPDQGTITKPSDKKDEPTTNKQDLLPIISKDRSGILNLSELGHAVDSIPLDQHPFFHRFAELLPCGLAILDHRAQAVFVNQFWYDLTTHTDDDQSFKAWPASIHPDDYDRVMTAYHEAFKSQVQLRTEFRALGHEDSPWRLLLLMPLGDENLEHVSLREYGGFICSVVDVSSEKGAELAERKAAQDAEERKEQQERFIDMVSHEIRNPLSAMTHCIEDMRLNIEKAEREHRQLDVNEVKEVMETIGLAVSQQRRVVNDVLSYSKVDATLLTLQPTPCRPAVELEYSLKIFHPELRKRNIAFSFTADTSYHELGIDWMLADLARISQVVVNLLTNAIKFTAQKDGDKQISVSVGASLARPSSYPEAVVYFPSEPDEVSALDGVDPIYITVAVADNGIGISTSGQEKLFERFRQATESIGEIYGGSGLGLNICRKMCRAHGGEIGVKAEEGEGSIFGFYFRAGRSDPPASVEEGDSPRQLDKADESNLHVEMAADELSRTIIDDHMTTSHDAAQHGEEQHMTKKPHILLCEDNAINRRVMVKRLESAGFTVSAAVNGEEGVRAVRLANSTNASQSGDATWRSRPSKTEQTITSAEPDKGNIELILMDEHMPLLSGSEATQMIRRLESEGVLQGRVGIISVSGSVGDDFETTDGVDDFIGKPFEFDELLEKIWRLVGKEGPRTGTG